MITLLFLIGGAWTIALFGFHVLDDPKRKNTAIDKARTMIRQAYQAEARKVVPVVSSADELWLDAQRALAGDLYAEQRVQEVIAKPVVDDDEFGPCDYYTPTVLRKRTQQCIRCGAIHDRHNIDADTCICVLCVGPEQTRPRQRTDRGAKT